MTRGRQVQYLLQYQERMDGCCGQQQQVLHKKEIKQSLEVDYHDEEAWNGDCLILWGEKDDEKNVSFDLVYHV